ncbi:MAG TPA: hypothetical protein VLG92_02610 [Candidatus Saccharimonadia bacterium]|nr:hypothetical protein [Candidatus Saccharimonadia bacterium]
MKRVRRHQGHFSYKNELIAYSFWSNTDDNQEPDVVLLLGAGQTDAIARMVAERAGTGVVVVEGVPHWHADPSAEDIEDFTKLYFESAYQKVASIFSSASMHVLAESQAAPAAIVLSSKLKGVGNLGLIRPLGFSVQAFGSTTEARLKTFRKRILQSLLQYPQSFLYDPRNLWVGAVITRAMLREASFASLSKKYAAGISYDSLQDFQHTAQVRHKAGNTISLILGEKDKMFPPEEITTALSSLHIPHVSIVILPSVSHSSLATRGSHKVLAAALKAVRNK